MVPLKILNPTQTAVTIHKGIPIGEFQILGAESQVHGTNLDERSSSGESLSCSHVNYETNNSKQQSDAEFLSIFNCIPMTGPRTKSRKLKHWY